MPANGESVSCTGTTTVNDTNIADITNSNVTFVIESGATVENTGTMGNGIEVSGAGLDNISIINRGTIIRTNGAGNATMNEGNAVKTTSSVTNLSFSNEGIIRVEGGGNSGYEGVVVRGTGIMANNSGTIIVNDSSSGDAILVLGDNSVFNNSGNITGTDSPAKPIFGVTFDGKDSVFNNTGTVSLTTDTGEAVNIGFGVTADGATLNNSGTIEIKDNVPGFADGFGDVIIIRNMGGDSFFINNMPNGIISHETNGDAIIVDDNVNISREFINNQGMIQGNITLNLGDDSIDNTGTITGNVSLGDGNDSFTNNGTTTGDVDTGAGNDTLINNANSTITGNVDLGDGDNSFTNSGTTTGDVSAGTGNDTLINNSNLTITGNVDLGDGDNSFTNSGTTTGDVTTGTGNDTLINNANSTIAGNIALGDGNNNFTNSGTTTGNVTTGTGADTLINNANSTITGNITLGDGDDTFNESGTIRNSNVDLGLGTDRMTVFSTALLENITALDGGDDASSGDGAVDQLIFDGWQGTVPLVNNWENITFTNSAIGNLGGSRTITTEQFTINNSATIIAIGSSPGAYTVTGNVVNNGTLTLGDVEANDTFTVGGNYSGTGQLVLDTVLAGDGAASDLLIVNGSSSGATSLTIQNAGGTGAETIGDGILVVQVDGVSTASSFTLANDYLIGGAYEYNLFFQNQAGTDQNWYLRSVGIRQEAPIYKSIPVVMGRFIWDSIGSFHERDTYDVMNARHGRVVNREHDNKPRTGWARVYSNNYKFRFDKANDFDADWSGFQAGLDLYRYYDKDRLQSARAGAYIGSGTFDEKVDGLNDQKIGDVDMTSYSVGLYTTVISDEGWYLDGIVQLSTYEFDSKSISNVKGDTDGKGLVASIEYGHPIVVTEDEKTIIEPQVQLAYQRLDFDKFDDELNNTKIAEIDIKDQNKVLLRAGIRAEQSIAYDQASLAHNQKNIKLYTEANLYKEWGNDIEVKLNDTKTTLDPGDIWYGLGLGVIGEVTENSSTFANVEWQRDLDGENHRGIKGEIGIRVLW